MATSLAKRILDMILFSAKAGSTVLFMLAGSRGPGGVQLQISNSNLLIVSAVFL